MHRRNDGPQVGKLMLWMFLKIKTHNAFIGGNPGCWQDDICRFALAICLKVMSPILFWRLFRALQSREISDAPDFWVIGTSSD